MSENTPGEPTPEEPTQGGPAQPTEPLPAQPGTPTAPSAGGGSGSNRTVLWAVLGVLAAIAVIVVVVLVATGGDDETTESSAPVATEPVATEAPTTETPATEPPATEPAATEAPTTEAPPATDAPAGLEGDLVGLFSLRAGECSVAGEETGSFFRMVMIGGTLDAGPFVPNADSPCADQTFTPLTPGADGGLITGSLQPAPDPAFDASGNATADRIAAPVTFFGVAFGMATTDEADPPSISATGGELSGNLAAVSAYYGGEVFNQGAPKPDGSAPGLTSEMAMGTIDPATGDYVLDWASQVVGGPFNEYTGVWHLEGTFTAS
jgi:hypothetical protein